MTFRCYIRLSKDELLKTSPETQRRVLAAYAASHDPTRPIMFYEDLGESGGDWERPGFMRMEAEAQPGDVVLVTSDDRFARDVDFHRAKLKAFAKKGVEVRFLNLPLDITTATGEFASTISAAAAAHYRRVIMEKTEAAVPTIREKHIHWGRWPDLFEVVVEDGRRVVRPSVKALELLRRAELVGVTRATQEAHIPRIKVYRLRCSYQDWLKTKPWFVSEKYDERREEYTMLRRARRGEDPSSTKT